jgi:hypothetical protein
MAQENATWRRNLSEKQNFDENGHAERSALVAS